jgi:hypothetical protein
VLFTGIISRTQPPRFLQRRRARGHPHHDGVGEWATLSVGHAGEPLTVRHRLSIARNPFPHSLGMLYSTFTAF